MSQSKGVTKRVAAAVVGTLVVATGVVVFSATVVADRIIALQTDKAQASAAAPAFSINRENKSDPFLVTAARHERVSIKTAEMAGVQTEPLANVTVVTKNVDLPEVTIRESDASQVRRAPVEKPKPESRGKSEQPHGCESAFARPAPESLTRLSSRCVT